jgi:hypothetical protein
MAKFLFVAAVVFFSPFCPDLRGQISSFPYTENFDNVAAPILPVGWTTTTNRNISGDFTTSTTSVHSSPNCASSTNGRISQSLVSPVFNFAGKYVDSLIFYERRTSTHLSGLVVEASLNGDTSFSIHISDTLKQVNSTSYVKRVLALPEVLNNQANVRLRWRVLTDSSSGSTGVIRFDDIKITVKKAVDLAATSLSFSPASPRKGETVTATVGIINKALAGNFSFNVQLFDSLTLIASTHVSRLLETNETINVQLQYPNIGGGRHPLSAKIVLNGDEDTTNNAISSVLYANFLPKTILVNEIMYHPSDSKEWVEIINTSNDTIDLAQWKVSDSHTDQPVTMTASKTPFCPKTYLLFAKDTTFKNNFLNFNGQIIRIANLPTLNDDSDAVVLIDPTGITIDSVFYHSSWGGTNGKSLERIDTAASSTLQSNWQTSRNPLGATPGFINSVSKKEYDVSAERISFSPQFPIAGQQIILSATIKNIGRQPLQNILVKFFLDANKDSVLTASEMFSQQSIGTLTANDSVTVAATTSPLQQETHWIFVSISAQQDDDSTNNLQKAGITVGIQPRSIVINEIMFAPKGDEPEWFECYNTTSTEISVAGWKSSDLGPTKAVIQNGGTTIQPHSFFVVAHDTTTFKNYYTVSVPLFQSSFSALNNTSADAVVLYDDRAAVIDSVFYHPSWGGTNGNSLQRFDFFGSSNDSLNWLPSAPSPGINNPVAKKEFDAAMKRFGVEKNGTGVHFSCILLNTGRQTITDAALKLFHDINGDGVPQPDELLHSLEVSSFNTSDSIELSWDWNAEFVGKQNFIAVIECAQDERAENDTGYISIQNGFASQALVINEIMYDPANGDAEFVELYNRSSDSIDVYNWKLMNQPSSSGKRTSVVLSKVRSFLPPKEFIIIATDSSMFTQFPQLVGKNVVVNSSFALNNSGEDVVLADLTDMQIDSVHYSPSWHLKNISTKGRSLERINPNGSSNDARNWSSSVSSGAATPGEKNSIYTPSLPAASSLSLSPNPFSPDNDGFEDFLSINYVLPTNSATVRLRIYDVTGRLVRLLANDEPASSSGTIIWNGLDDKGERVRIGMYIILFEALDNFGGTVRTMKDVAVVAAKL